MAGRFQRNRKNLPFRQKAVATNPAFLQEALRTGSNQITVTLNTPLYLPGGYFAFQYAVVSGGVFSIDGDAAPYDGSTTIVCSTAGNLAADVVLFWIDPGNVGSTPQGGPLQSSPLQVGGP